MKLAIVTKNAIHGGVEALIALHQRHTGAEVFVCGGFDQPELTPFTYTYCRTADDLRLALRQGRYEVIEYHWLFEKDVAVILESGIPCLEVVHRTDTAECDKQVPHVLVTHSQFLAEFLLEQTGRTAHVIPNAIDVEQFADHTALPVPERYVMGAITKYDLGKGMDLVLRAWARVQGVIGEHVSLRMYGEGALAEYLQRMILVLGLRDVEIRGPIRGPERYLPEFSCIVHPSRMEGMPIAIQEALACNLPVIATALPGMEEFNARAAEALGTAPLTLVPPDDVDALASAMLAYGHSRVRTAPCGLTRPYIEATYGAAQHMAAMHAVYEEARQAAGQRAPARAPVFLVNGTQPTLLVLGEPTVTLNAACAILAVMGWNVVQQVSSLSRAHVQVRSNYLKVKTVTPDVVTRPLVVLCASADTVPIAASLNPQATAYWPADESGDVVVEGFARQYADVIITPGESTSAFTQTRGQWFATSASATGELLAELSERLLGVFCAA